MTTPRLPDSWDDEPIDDLLPPPAASSVHGGRLQHWSDSHDPDDLPQMDVDEVWDRAVDWGISYEQAEARMMKAQMQSRQWRSAPGGSAPNTHITVDSITRIMRDLVNMWGGGFQYDPNWRDDPQPDIQGLQHLINPPVPRVTHMPIPNDDPVLGAIWDDILNRSDPDRIVTPDDPDYGHHARLIRYDALRTNRNPTAHFDIKDIGPA